MSKLIAHRIDVRRDGWWLAQVFVEGQRVAKQEVQSVEAGEQWAENKISELMAEIRDGERERL